MLVTEMDNEPAHTQHHPEFRKVFRDCLKTTPWYLGRWEEYLCFGGHKLNGKNVEFAKNLNLEEVVT
jgi:hypothetical protein